MTDDATVPDLSSRIQHYDPGAFDFEVILHHSRVYNKPRPSLAGIPENESLPSNDTLSNYTETDSSQSAIIEVQLDQAF